MERFQPGERVTTLVSGGLDSSVLVAWAAAQGLDQLALFFASEQAVAKREEACARRVCESLAVRFELVQFGPLWSALSDRQIAESQGPHLRVLEAGSVLSHLIAASIGFVEDRYTLLTGIHQSDLADWPPEWPAPSVTQRAVFGIFASSPDSRRSQLLFPFLHMPQSRVIELGLELGVDLGQTWSCHESDGVPCARCRSCRNRAAAFAAARVPDPLSS